MACIRIVDKRGLKGDQVSQMPSGFFRLKGPQLYAKAKSEKNAPNPHRLSFRARSSYQTIHRLVNDTNELNRLDLTVLWGFLIDGCGFSWEEIREWRFGDIFAAHINGDREGA